MKRQFSVKTLVIVPLILFAGSCALTSRQEYQTQLNGWIGKTEVELVEQFGPPQHSVEEDANKKILSWHSSKKTSSGSSRPVGGGVSIGLSFQSEDTCELSFTLVDGIAKSLEWKAKHGSLFGEREFWHSGECGSAFPATPKG
ncbi:MAG: hypothetical protein OXC18_07640 [Desulfurellaceae bacterium]|nr:hypothetical protein [Desulfurellaceae bacterium]